jgi:uncharacterized protein YjbI with pentapeptide repeats
MGVPPEASAACVAESSGIGRGGPFVVRLTADCAPAEREARAVGGETIIEAVATGRAVDLVGVIVDGDLIFDRLTVQSSQPVTGAPPDQETRVDQLNAGELRVAREAIAIRDAVVSGAVRHGSAKGRLQFDRPVDFRGTVFKRGVDLSRSVFRDRVTLSDSTFEEAAYFVQVQFAQTLECRETKFGPHTRFHRSTLGGPVDCAGALFDGVAEFLEVTFEQPVSFERARFGSGTGFSGSRFRQRARFDEAVFSRDTFFGFSVFEAVASFAGTQFLGSADFSDAQFMGQDDLAKARFDRPPLLTRTKRLAQDRPSGFMSTPAAHYALTVACLVTAAILMGYVLKGK